MLLRPQHPLRSEFQHLADGLKELSPFTLWRRKVAMRPKSKALARSGVELHATHTQRARLTTFEHADGLLVQRIRRAQGVEERKVVVGRMDGRGRRIASQSRIVDRAVSSRVAANARFTASSNACAQGRLAVDEVRIHPPRGDGEGVATVGAL